MSRVVYVNGSYRPYASALVHAEDRGFQFADSVYEVCTLRHGEIVDQTRHLTRLARSLDELGIARPMSDAAWIIVIRETVRRNRVHNGMVYLQVSRGEGKRNFFFPGGDTAPTVVVLARSSVTRQVADDERTVTGIAVKTVKDIRWGRRDIKTTMLLPAALAKEAAKADGGKEAWLVDDEGYITEGASSNAWIITQDNKIITRQISNDILRGVTRMTLMDFIHAEGLAIEERPFSVAEALAAKEAFVTAATNPVTPVVKIDGHVLGNGHPGLLTLKLRDNLHNHAELIKI